MHGHIVEELVGIVLKTPLRQRTNLLLAIFTPADYPQVFLHDLPGFPHQGEKEMVSQGCEEGMCPSGYEAGKETIEEQVKADLPIGHIRLTFFRVGRHWRRPGTSSPFQEVDERF